VSRREHREFGILAHKENYFVSLTSIRQIQRRSCLTIGGRRPATGAIECCYEDQKDLPANENYFSLMTWRLCLSG
jgi:hypothetical protein